MNIDLIKHYLSVLQFKLINGDSAVYSKNVNNYELQFVVDLEKIEKSTINYGSKIKVHRKTTTNLSQSENLVVLECVCRLLEKGYNPESIELEKSWNLGHKGKGFLDIFVKDKESKSLFMIECKNWGEEFNKEKNKMFKDGGQLLSYFRQDRKVSALCLYASKIDGDKITYTSEIIDTKGLAGDNDEEIFLSWDNTFNKKGIFENEINAYEFKNIGLTYNDLDDLEKSDGQTIFHQFAEILRKHIVSDKPNAFNKIFNLFICKIQDEDTKFNKPNDDLDFQVKASDNSESLFDRLNTLYKTGLENYIDILIPDVSRDEFETMIKHTQDEKLRETFNKLRYYRSSQEFAFKDVYDKDTFEENAEVVREVVKLLQKFKIKYSKKHQHLGDFFELLLNTGFKQESGQFFTPIPLTRFICKSLPIQKIIDIKLENDENVLPYVIDYASGSGHFITEMMDEIDIYVNRIDESQIKTGRKAINNFKSQKDNLKWAEKYVYAIEKDYRLVKISKVSSFLNGDGDANVMSADGLAPFDSDKYKGVLYKKEGGRENNVFDVLIANPPYSVSGFQNTLKDGKKCFELYDSLTDKSSEIECLFIERTKQLMKDGGAAGIVLPISILTNGGIYEKTREIILRNFNINGIVSLGSNAFMATGTKTIILFLEKKSWSEFAETERVVDEFFKHYSDVVCGGFANAFSIYARNVYEMDFEDYISILQNKPTDKAKTSEMMKEYKALSNEDIIKLEREKLIYFTTTYSQKIVLADSGEKDIEKEFYGYEFSNRRGHEGIHIYKDEEGNLNSKLYNEDFDELEDKNKLNSYILRNFNRDKNIERDIAEIQTSEDHPLKNHIHYVRLSQLMSFDLKRFDKSINLNKRNNLKIESKWELVKLGEICEIKKGTSITKEKTIEGNIPVVAGGLDIAYYHNEANRKAPIITVSASGKYAGCVNFWKQDIFASDCSTILSNNSKAINEYLYYFLQSKQQHIYFLQRGKSQPHVYPEDLKEFKLPLPPLEVQEKIVAEISEIEKKEEKVKEVIVRNSEKINDLIGKGEMVRIGNIGEIKSGGTPSTKISEYWKSEINWATLVDVKEKYLHETKRKISKKGLENSNATLLPINTILFSSRATIGDVSIAKVELATNQGFKNLICNSDLANYEYVYYVLKIEGQKLKDNFSRTTYGEINTTQFSDIKIPLPPIAEQKKIIAQIEPLEKEIEEAKAFLESVKGLKNEVLERCL